MTEQTPDGNNKTEPGPRAELVKIPSIDTGTLFSGAKEVVLIHKGEPYRLRQTQSGKLILTK